jgi:hypothetical protein
LVAGSIAAAGYSFLEADMKFPFASLFLLIFPCFLCLLNGCGGNMMMSATSRQLQSITVTPAAATAQNTSRQMQFTAMGSFNMAPMSSMPQVLWSIGNPFSAMPTPGGITINQNGLASCSTFSGTVAIEATAPMDPAMPLMEMGMMTSNVAGMAQLTCP